MNRILLHICCAPCLPHVLNTLRESHRVTGFFTNANIEPEEEYRFRERELQLIADKLNLTVGYDDYQPEKWRKAVRGFEMEPERGSRCPLCFRFRLERTFTRAREGGFDAVATTLSISSHKDISQINSEGVRLAESTGIEFLAIDFKKRDGALLNRQLGDALAVKRQNYCGCRFSRP